MHKGIMVITKADSKEEALSNVRELLEEYRNTVWDWHQIGGRWTNTLSPMYDKFMEEAKKLFGKKEKESIYQSDIDANQAELQKIWATGLKCNGKNPYCNHYKLGEDGGYYDVLELPLCLEKVKEWQQTIEDAKKKEEKAKDWLNGKRGTNDYNMYGYCLACASKLYQQDFGFDTNVYNLEECNYSIPDNPIGYFVIMFDIHN